MHVAPLLVALALALGCKSRPTPAKGEAQAEGAPLAMDSPFSTTPPRAAVAPGLSYNDEDFSLSTERARECHDTAPFPPREGSRRLSVPLTVRVTGKRTVPLSPLSFRLVDAEGSFHGATLAGCAPPLKPQLLQPGMVARGSVAFDVPAEAAELELLFEPFVIGRPSISARVKVQRAP